MAFDTWFYFPQGEGGPNPEGVRRGAALLQRALQGAFHAVPVTAGEAAEPEHGIRYFTALEKNLGAARGLLGRLSPASLFTLGGDCSVDIASIEALHVRYGERLGVLWIDAHADINTPATSPSAYFHGMPVRALLGEGDALMRSAQPLIHRQFCYAGLRSIDPDERKYIAAHSIPCLSSREINDGNYAALRRWLREAGIETLHVHLDLDALDPAESISVTYREPGGIALAAMAALLAFLRQQAPIVGFTVTEYAPKQEDAEEIGRILALLRPMLQLEGREKAVA